MTELQSAVWVSITVSLSATALCALAGLPAGCLLALRDFAGKRAVLALLNTLLALPTVVVGLVGYLLLCRRGPLGPLHLLFTPGAIVFGEFILALPIMVVFAHAAVAGVDRAARDTARTLGAGPAALAWTLLSEARFGILAAVAATFGRLVGEVGIAMMLGGNISGYTRTMTTAIALEASKGQAGPALQLGGVLLAIAVAVNVVLRVLQGQAGSEAAA